MHLKGFIKSDFMRYVLDLRIKREMATAGHLQACPFPRPRARVSTPEPRIPPDFCPCKWTKRVWLLLGGGKAGKPRFQDDECFIRTGRIIMQTYGCNDQLRGNSMRIMKNTSWAAAHWGNTLPEAAAENQTKKRSSAQCFS